MSRIRRDDYVRSEKARAFADLLYHEVVKLDCGKSPFELADQIITIGKAMRK